MEFACGTCRTVHAGWKPRCTSCGEWNQLTKVVGSMSDRGFVDRGGGGRGSGDREAGDRGGGSHGTDGSFSTSSSSMGNETTVSAFSAGGDSLSSFASVPVFVSEVSEEEIARTPTGIEPFDRVTGGGLVPAAIVLLGGPRGIGKSTLLMQVVDKVPCRWSLYATGEETKGQVANRAHRLNCVNPKMRLLQEQNIDRILSYAVELGVDLLIVDSIQTMVTSRISSGPGTPQQVKACTELVMSFSRTHNAKVIMICHLTKDGGLAGPESLQHLVDVILSFEQHEEIPALRQLRCAGKNRFGGVLEVGEFEMRDDGLAPISRGETADREERRLKDRDSSREDSLLPIVQELVYQLLDNGIEIDAGLLDRMGGVGGGLDLVPRTKPGGIE